MFLGGAVNIAWGDFAGDVTPQDSLHPPRLFQHRPRRYSSWLIVSLNPREGELKLIWVSNPNHVCGFIIILCKLNWNRCRIKLMRGNLQLILRRIEFQSDSIWFYLIAVSPVPRMIPGWGCRSATRCNAFDSILVLTDCVSNVFDLSRPELFLIVISNTCTILVMILIQVTFELFQFDLELTQGAPK